MSALALYDPLQGSLVDVKKLAEGAVPDIAAWDTPVSKAYHHFRSSGLQHLCVIDNSYTLVGIMTRTDLAHFCGLRQEGVEHIRAVMNRRDALIAAGAHRLKLTPVQLGGMIDDQQASDCSEITATSSNGSTPCGTPRIEEEESFCFPSVNQPVDTMDTHLQRNGNGAGSRLEGDAAAGEVRELN